MAAQLLTAASTAAKLAGVTPKLLQQLSNTSQLQPTDLETRPDALDTVRRMSTLSEQLPWQLRLQPAQQLPASTPEQASAEDIAVPTEAEPEVTRPLLAVASASEVGSFAEQQHQQGLTLLSMTHEGSVFGASSMMSDVGQSGKGDEETAARAAYRQWSESFEAGRVIIIRIIIIIITIEIIIVAHRQALHSKCIYMQTILFNDVDIGALVCFPSHVNLSVAHTFMVLSKARDMSLDALSEADSGI